MSRNYGPDTADDAADLLELDLEPVATVAPTTTTVVTVGPAITTTQPQRTPLEQARDLVGGCTMLSELQALAGRLNDANTAAGAWFKALPEATANEVRLMWRARRDHFVLAQVRAAWPLIWGSLSSAITQRQAAQAAPAVVTEEPATLSIENAGTLVGALTNASTEAANNAAGAGIGSMATGEMLGVGWRNAEGYVTALANGVKKATADEYLRILVVRFKYTQAQIAALTVTLLNDNVAPAAFGAGGTVDATQGMTPREATAWRRANSPAALAKKSKAEAEALAKKVAQDEQNARDAEAERILIAGLVNSREGLIVSPGTAWDGYKVPLIEFVKHMPEKFQQRGLVPGLKTDEALFGRIMSGFKSGGLYAFAAKRQNATEWPSEVKSRWIVQRLDMSTDLTKSGDKELIADLVRVADANGKKHYEVRFVGGSAEMRTKVLEAFTERKDAAMLDVGDLYRWLKTDVLTNAYKALRWGGFWLVPGTREHTSELEELLTAVREVAGREIGIGETTTGKKWSRGVSTALSAEVRKVGKSIEAAMVTAQNRAREKAIAAGLDTQGQDIAARQARLTDEVARNRLKDLRKVEVVVAGYMELLADEEKAQLAMQIKAHREYCEQFLDDTAVMMANLELDEDEDASDEDSGEYTASPYADDSGEIELEVD
jgi:hypothetical protein